VWLEVYLIYRKCDNKFYSGILEKSKNVFVALRIYSKEAGDNPVLG
jgi:hypothetical protein